MGEGMSPVQGTGSPYPKGPKKPEIVGGGRPAKTPTPKLYDRCPKCGNEKSFIKEKEINGYTKCVKCGYKDNHVEFVKVKAM